MIVKNYSEIEALPVTQNGAKNTSIRWLIGEKSGAPHFYLRFFEIESGGNTPFHAHPWEHEIFILEGNGQINTEGKSLPVKKWDFALVLPQEKHQIQNTGTQPLRLLCIIPKDGA